MEDSQETQGQAPAPATATARPQSMWHEGLGQGEGEKKSSKRRMFSQIPQAMPLRTWLVILLVVVSGLGITGSSFAVNSIMRNVLFNNVDDELRSASTTWARDISNDFFIGDHTKRPPTEYVVLNYLPDGTIRYSGPSSTTPNAENIPLGGYPTTVGSIENNTKWRALAFADSNGVITVIAKDMTHEKEILHGLAMVQVTIAAIALAAIAAVGFWFIRRALRPLRVVEKTASEIAAGDLDKRVPKWPLHTEVGQLAAALNIMLGQLQRSVVRAQEKEEQMRRFVGDASHELRTPLTSLRGYTELYRSGATKDVDLVFSKIDDESKRMSLLVEDLLALTRAEGTRLDMHPVDLLELALSVGSSARAAFPGREIKVANDAKSIPVVNGDASRLHQVLLNLVTNGIRHGGEDATVTLRLRREANDVLVDVIDDGKGMSQDDAAHIFERFYRADTSRTRDTGGSGLGLAIVHSLVEQHDGSISVDSELGRGTTFTVRLPALADAPSEP
ncbi:HAMP domain-containing sensor histidine kinase [Corynebacterium marquesiae]|uniref:histidine kinase n=1 Tax=Corynebacterium marquesiae TaxID=2913503 RepID=A0ABU8P6E5_9CORY